MARSASFFVIRLTGLLLGVVPVAAHAFCGFFAGKADASLFNEASQVVLARDGNKTVISMLNDYKGPLRQFALVVPTPTVVKQGDVRVAEKATFARLDAYSSPRLAEYHDADPCRVQFFAPWSNAFPAPVPQPAARPEAKPRSSRALGVTVEAAFTLEEYDIVSLSATQSAGLETWLRTNGYVIPKGASAALKPYINQGMKFFVAKVNLTEQAKTGFSYLRPLQFAFESEKFMLPMRLGMLNAPPGQPQDLIVFVLTRKGRVESSNYRTIKLPANVNLPAFVKPRFQDFYQAMFTNAAATADHKAVFTEYFWDMAWCDPCAADPLSGDELRKAGASWISGDRGPGGVQPALLTRLHVRYTPATFPEDLMFTETGDRQNWQTRYVIQNPFPGTVAACSERVGAMECESMCKSQFTWFQKLAQQNPKAVPPSLKGRSDQELLDECASRCAQSKQAGIDTAFAYYTKTLPERVATEKSMLARLTGWAPSAIDAMPGGRTIEENAEFERQQARLRGATPMASGSPTHSGGRLAAGGTTR